VVVAVRGVSVGRAAAAVAVRASAACATPTTAAAATMPRMGRVERAKERMVASEGGKAAGGGVRQGVSCAVSCEENVKKAPPFASMCRKER